MPLSLCNHKEFTMTTFRVPKAGLKKLDLDLHDFLLQMGVKNYWVMDLFGGRDDLFIRVKSFGLERAPF